MNDVQLVLAKLEQLAHAAMDARSEFEKAAIFGAVRAFANDLDEEDPGTLGENIERACGSICAILGYDITNGHSKEQHLSWAIAALQVLKHTFPERA